VSKYKGWIVLGILLFVAIFLGGCPLIGYGNSEADLRTRVEASQQANQVVYDRVWKTIQQQAGVTDKYQESFRSIYKDIMDARNPDGQAKLVKFVTESNPNFDSGLFKTLMTSIEANRRDFEREQKTLIDIHREHTTMFRQFPSSFYLSILGRKEISIQLVTSTRTDNAFKSGKDDDTELFKSNK
jgi:hypothetical protein